MFQRSNWQHFLRLQAALVRFLTYLKTLGDLALNCAGTAQFPLEPLSSDPMGGATASVIDKTEGGRVVL